MAGARASKAVLNKPQRCESALPGRTMEDLGTAPGRLSNGAEGVVMQMGAALRSCQQHLGQMCSFSLAASAQLQMSACQNVHNLAEAVAHPSSRSFGRRRCRPSMMCCLSSAAGGASAPSSSTAPSVKMPRGMDAGALHASRDLGAAEANSTDNAAGSPEEPILISEVSGSCCKASLLIPELLSIAAVPRLSRLSGRVSS